MTKSKVEFITEPTVWVIAQTVMHTMSSASPLFKMKSPIRPGGESLIEFAGRACYQSFDNEGKKSNQQYIENILDHRHGSVLEHDSISFYITGVSRNLTHELVRHRAGTAISQLSQRYVDESDTAFVIPPEYLRPENESLLVGWKLAMARSRELYQDHADTLLEGIKLRFPDLSPRDQRKKAREAARSVLPGSCETRIVLTANMRAWRHMMEMRAVDAADAEICRLFAQYVLPHLVMLRPNVFQDFEHENGADGRQIASNLYRKV